MENLNHASLDRQRLGELSALGLQLLHFFDVGASNGVWSSQVAEDYPNATYDLFEPLADHVPSYLEKLESRLATNPRFRLHKVALGSVCKRATLYRYPNPAGSTALALGRTPPDTTCVEVEMLTIDYVVRESRLPVPQVLKIDAQGCELDILKGATDTLPALDVLLLECWLTRGYGTSTPLLVEVMDWLRDFNFYLWDFGNPWRDARGSLYAQDCFFLNARCKVSPLRPELSMGHPAHSAARPPGFTNRLFGKLEHFFTTTRSH
jgi:FkbM family methyltransferase